MNIIISCGSLSSGVYSERAGDGEVPTSATECQSLEYLPVPIYMSPSAWSEYIPI